MGPSGALGSPLCRILGMLDRLERKLRVPGYPVQSSRASSRRAQPATIGFVFQRIPDRRPDVYETRDPLSYRDFRRASASVVSRFPRFQIGARRTLPQSASGGRTVVGVRARGGGKPKADPGDEPTGTCIRAGARDHGALSRLTRGYTTAGTHSRECEVQHRLCIERRGIELGSQGAGAGSQ